MKYTRHFRMLAALAALLLLCSFAGCQPEEGELSSAPTESTTATTTGTTVPPPPADRITLSPAPEAVDASGFTQVFPNETVRALWESYRCVAQCNRTANSLRAMGLPIEDTIYDRETDMELTEIPYETYLQAAKKLVTDELMAKVTPYTLCQNRNGKLVFSDGGKSGGSTVVLQVMPTTRGTYVSCEAYTETSGTDVRLSEFGVADRDGTCVVAWVAPYAVEDALTATGEFGFRNDDDHWPTDTSRFTNDIPEKEARAVAEAFFKLVALGDEPLSLLRALGFTASGDSAKTDKDGFYATNIPYTDFRRQALTHVSERWFQSTHSLFAQQYKNVDGTLWVKKQPSANRTYTVASFSGKWFEPPAYMMVVYARDTNADKTAFGRVYAVQLAFERSGDELVIGWWEVLAPSVNPPDNRN